MIRKAKIKQFVSERNYVSRDGLQMVAIEAILELPYYRDDGNVFNDAIVAVRHVEADKKPTVTAWIGKDIEVTLSFCVREYNGKYYQNATITNIKPL